MIAFPITLYWIQKRNLTYYKLHGRTPLEIECWLKKQPWYISFKYNIQQSVLDKYRFEDDFLHITDKIKDEVDQKLDNVLSGDLDKQTISSAFPWMTTDEGTKYWAAVEYKFLKWYFGQYVDFYLTK